MRATDVERITLAWRIGGVWTSRDLALAAYYEDGPLTVDTIERHTHAVDYLDVARATLEATRLTLRAGDRERTVTEAFYNGGQSRIIERSDTGEIIVDARIDGGWHVLRLVRIDGELRAVADHVMLDPR